MSASLWESSVVGAITTAPACWMKVMAARAAERKRVVRILGLDVNGFLFVFYYNFANKWALFKGIILNQNSDLINDIAAQITLLKAD